MATALHLPNSRAGAAIAPLPPRALLVLQLRARGYPRGQTVELLGMPTPALAEAEQSACAALGGATVEEAVELARRRGLIL